MQNTRATTTAAASAEAARSRRKPIRKPPRPNNEKSRIPFANGNEAVPFRELAEVGDSERTPRRLKVPSMLIGAVPCAALGRARQMLADGLSTPKRRGRQ
jgi:hypothetical protein